jgi:hypothetical protein
MKPVSCISLVYKTPACRRTGKTENRSLPGRQRQDRSTYSLDLYHLLFIFHFYTGNKADIHKNYYFNRFMKEREIMIHNYMEGYNNFDVDKMVADFSPGFVFENITNGIPTHEVQGVEAFKEQAAQAAAYFSERKQTAASFDHHPDRTDVDVAYHAILALDFPTGEKAGEILILAGKSIFRFEGNKISGITDVS